MNWPIWLPIESNISSNSGSGLRISRLTNSITPTARSSIRIGKPNPERKPSLLAIWIRGKLSRSGTSVAHLDWPVAQMRPGRPSPLWNVSSRVAFSKAGNSCPGKCQRSTQCSTCASSSSRQKAPNSQPSPSQIERRINGDAATKFSASAKTRVSA